MISVTDHSYAIDIDQTFSLWLYNYSQIQSYGDRYNIMIYIIHRLPYYIIIIFFLSYCLIF